MKALFLRMGLATVFMFTGALAPSPVPAEKPSWAGGEKGEKNQHKEMHEGYDGKDDSVPGGSYERSTHDKERYRFFTEQHRSFIHDYYASQYRKGKCPPGLAKKGNGCMPPGQAKKWAIGRQLPRDVIFHDLPPSVLVELGPAPSRHRFVRVAQDILLITAGVGMVVDAIEDLSWEFEDTRGSHREY